MTYGVRATQAAFFTLTLIACTSCGSGRVTTNPFTGTPVAGAPDEIHIEVRNLNFNEVTVWAMRDRQRIRVGRVTGKTDRTFTIEWNVAFPIWFELDLVADVGDCRTGLIRVEPDSRVWVSIPSYLGVGQCRVGR